MIVLSEIDSFIIDQSSYFDNKYAPQELGMENPWRANFAAWRKRHPYTHNADGSFSIDFELNGEKEKEPYDREYIDKYIQEREKFISRKLFEVYGYTIMKRYSEKYNVEISVKPCEGADGQCNMECDYFGTC